MYIENSIFSTNLHTVEVLHESGADMQRHAVDLNCERGSTGSGGLRETAENYNNKTNHQSCIHPCKFLRV